MSLGKGKGEDKNIHIEVNEDKYQKKQLKY